MLNCVVKWRARGPKRRECRILDALCKSVEGLTGRELGFKARIWPRNVYTYLNEMQRRNLVVLKRSGKFAEPYYLVTEVGLARAVRLGLALA